MPDIDYIHVIANGMTICNRVFHSFGSTRAFKNYLLVSNYSILIKYS